MSNGLVCFRPQNQQQIVFGLILYDCSLIAKKMFGYEFFFVGCLIEMIYTNQTKYMEKDNDIY